ncbi:MAG: hypothetical protein ACK4L4_11610 [Gemmobacter sp.]
MPRWFHELTGLPAHDRAAVRAQVVPEGHGLRCLANGRLLWPGQLHMPALRDLRRDPIPARGPLRLSEVVADVQALHLDPAHAGAVFQVASQFNLLEMVSPEVTPDDGIDRYIHDKTQGPACAVACGAGTLWRNDFVPLSGGTGQTETRQIDCLADLGAALGNGEGRLWEMRNGYALPRPGGLAAVAHRLAALDVAGRDALRGMVRVGIQADTEVTLRHAGHRVTQIYCSALPVLYGDDPAQDWEPFARLVLEAAYEATFRAALRHAAPDAPLFLTLLGGGAFGNRRAWIVDAIARSVDMFENSGLDVRLVSFRVPSGAL